MSEVNGVIESIQFVDDQFVRKNMPLVKIEDALFRAQFERASAALNIAKANYASASNSEKLTTIALQADVQKSGASARSADAVRDSVAASINEAKEELRASAVDIDYFKQNYEREKDLSEQKAISSRDFETTQRLYKAKVANHAALQAKLAKLEKLFEAEQGNAFNVRKTQETLDKSQAGRVENARTEAAVAKDRIAVAQADYDLAKLNLERTTSRAKLTGSITNRRISAGEYIEVGQRIASIVSCQDRPWVTANFKETQIERMRKGQKAEIAIDTYPGTTFKGTVESVSSGSGSTFSVLPPENATGNFTKVVKRMPVKILLDNVNDKVLRVGSSVDVRVFVD